MLDPDADRSGDGSSSAGHPRPGGDLSVPVRASDACPGLAAEQHLSLVGASVVVAAPTAGLLLTLIAWGAAADRFGERIVISTGLALATIFLALTTVTHGPVPLCVLLALAGAAGASVNAASGRVVMGWFAVDERGLAMGARQTAQPLGVAIAALTLPPLAHGHGLHAALLFAATCSGVMAVAVAVLVTDPPRPSRAESAAARSPYRGPVLWRIHAASALLVVPQFAVSAFTLVYLVSQRHWIPRRPAAWCSPSRSPAPPGGSRPASGRTRYAAGSRRCANSRSPARR